MTHITSGQSPNPGMTAQQSWAIAFPPQCCHISGNPSRAPSLQEARPLPKPCGHLCISHFPLQRHLGEMASHNRRRLKKKANSPTHPLSGAEVLLWARPLIIQGIVDNAEFLFLMNNHFLNVFY